MNFDDVLKKIGGFGKFQMILYTWICLPHISIAMHMLVSVFAGATPAHFCRDPPGGHAPVPSATTAPPTAGESAAANGTERPRCGSRLNESGWQPCATGWDYDRSVFTSTVVTEWDLVCTRSYLNNVGSSIFMLGLMVGAPVLGTMADKYGRKSVILVSMAIQTAFGLGAAFAPNFVMYALARFMVGVAISGVIMNAFVLATEWTGIGERMLAGIATQQAFGVGYMLLAPVAYFIRDWRQLQLAISIPEILFIAYIWLLPRSARWLLANNQHDKAESLVRRAAEINGMSLPDDLLKSEMVKQKLAASPQQAHSVLDLFRTPRLRKQSLILFYSWFAITLVYYGLSLGISDLGLDIFLTQFIFGAVEIPARFLLLATLPKSRRMSQVGFLAFGGLFCILTVTVPSDMSTVRTGLAMLGKFGVTASFVVIFIYTAEIYPTVIRQMGVGMSSMFARFGGVLAPLVSLAFPPGHAGPMAMFGAMSLLAAALTLALPETANRPLPDSIADTERDDGEEEEEEQRQSEGRGRRV
uniref:Organic cation transporter protein-like isoform X1 n=2 Tax=Petromyzon marinus TaxID=7757 RepID=A0AAJ7TY66_PETMA|nr:organic cation transporter protein-like isoform X1 [Petromyzon marinus]